MNLKNSDTLAERDLSLDAGFLPLPWCPGFYVSLDGLDFYREFPADCPEEALRGLSVRLSVSRPRRCYLVRLKEQNGVWRTRSAAKAHREAHEAHKRGIKPPEPSPKHQAPSQRIETRTLVQATGELETYRALLRSLVAFDPKAATAHRFEHPAFADLWEQAGLGLGLPDAQEDNEG